MSGCGTAVELTCVPNASVLEDGLDHLLVLPLGSIVHRSPAKLILVPGRCVVLLEQAEHVRRGLVRRGGGQLELNLGNVEQRDDGRMGSLRTELLR